MRTTSLRTRWEAPSCWRRCASCEKKYVGFIINVPSYYLYYFTVWWKFLAKKPLHGDDQEAERGAHQSGSQPQRHAHRPRTTLRDLPHQANLLVSRRVSVAVDYLLVVFLLSLDFSILFISKSSPNEQYMRINKLSKSGGQIARPKDNLSRPHFQQNMDNRTYHHPLPTPSNSNTHPVTFVPKMAHNWSVRLQ